MADDLTRLGGDSDSQTIMRASESATILSVVGSGRSEFRGDVEPPTSGGNSPTVLEGQLPPEGVERATPAQDAEHDAAEAGPLQPGEPFGARYHIIRVLGVGGMGAVYQAWDAELGVAVAIKVIRPEAMADPTTAAEIARRFKRELLLARQVTHKNVVRIHDLGEIDGIKYITMSYVDGADLASRLKREGTLPVPTVMTIARQVASGLVEAHKAGVVHRDLKPANIMIDRSGEALIMDFGIARSSAATSGAAAAGAASLPPGVRSALIAGATRYGAVVGTVEYMAPEQARGQDVDQRADIYAFGLILYDMLVGRAHRAQHTNSAIAELRARMEQPPPPPKSARPDLPDSLDQLIVRCLHPDPAHRFQTTEELAAAINGLDDNGIPIPEPRRLTVKMIAATITLVVALVAATWWLTHAPATQQHEPVTVVIADLQNNTDDPALNHTLEQTLRRGLESASFITAIDRSRIRVALGVPPPARLDDVGARELAVKQGLGVVLSGSIDRAGNGYEISVKAIQTVTGAVITTTKARAADKNGVLEAATKLMATVRKVLGDRTSTSDQLFAMRSLSTSSLDVVNQYAAAVEAQSNGNFEEARQAYLKAVQLDPKFGLGYQGLAAVSRNLGRLDDADKYVKEAFRYLDGMTERERYATRGYYYRTIGDNQQCAKEYGELLARYPADSVAHNQRAGCLYKLRDMQQARAEMQRAVQLLPNHLGYRTNLALLADLAGNFDAAEEEVKRLPQPTSTSLLVLAYSQLGRGLVRDAAQTYEKLGAMGVAGASSAASGLGDLAIYEGRFSDAVRILEEGAAADLAANNAAKAAIKLTSIAYAHLAQRQTDRAIAAADRALANSNGMAVRFLAARIFAEAGALDKAAPLAKALSSELPAEPQALGRIIQGQIALKKGNAREAIEILGAANGTLDTWFGHFDLGRAYLEANALPQADSEFDRCITRRGEALSLMDEGPTFGYFPVAFYYQGRVREGLRTASFANAYREYLTIRGQSTEDPLLPDARRRAGN